ncbi:MAG: hypothetical protein M3282_11475, partial [Gemmatimonadota bacterium]|nr:hypothetical protein [Gemmatimonadota bacterium]
ASGTRTLEYRLVADAPFVRLGLFLLGSMRVERDFQYAGRHRGPFSGPPFALQEIDRLLVALGRVPPDERRRHLALLGARDTLTLRTRLTPAFTTRRVGPTWVTRVTQPSLDGRDTMALELRADPSSVAAARVGNSVSLRARPGTQVSFTVRIETSAEPLTPLARTEIFTPEFLAFLNVAQRARATGSAAGDTAAIRARWLERQVRGVELLASREKLMAGLPNYATYFGRDMLVTALMMRPVWRPAMSELVVASVLRRLSPSGQVSHEEALGGQAVREAAAEYATLVEEYLRAGGAGGREAADSLLSRAEAVLRDVRRVRENYHMIDDEFQLPVLAARWLGDPGVAAQHKRAFLLDASGGGETRLDRLLRELALVSRMTAAYAADPVAANLVSFPPRDSGWSSASWRDSGAGYAGGRYAMDVNAIWAPHALESIEDILATIRALGFSTDSLARAKPDLMAGVLGAYARDSLALRRAIDAWWGASRYFVVRLGPDQVRSHVTSRLAAMPAGERDYWTGVLARSAADRDSLVFLAVALDAAGRPIGVANTDPATQLFLGDRGDASAVEGALRDVRLFVRAYPAGLLIDQAGPVVANDAYAPPAVWQAFLRDHYHGPRVVWGREVNLFLAGVANRIAAARGTPLERHVPELRAALQRVQSAADASGFQSELWSYEIRDGRLVPVRYGISSDVQLWSTTDLAVEFALSRLRR